MAITTYRTLALSAVGSVANHVESIVPVKLFKGETSLRASINYYTAQGHERWVYVHGGPRTSFPVPRTQVGLCVGQHQNGDHSIANSAHGAPSRISSMSTVPYQCPHLVQHSSSRPVVDRAVRTPSTWFIRRYSLSGLVAHWHLDCHGPSRQRQRPCLLFDTWYSRNRW